MSEDLIEVLLPREAAGIVRVHVETIRRLVRRGLLPAARLPNGRIRVRRADVLRLLSTGGAKGDK